jgi:hypothetical protein
MLEYDRKYPLGMLEGSRIAIMCIPAWGDTLCGETNEGYFDLQQSENLRAQ